MTGSCPGRIINRHKGSVELATYPFSGFRQSSMEGWGVGDKAHHPLIYTGKTALAWEITGAAQ